MGYGDERSATTNPAIALDSVSVSRGGRTVLHDVSCVVSAGELIGLIGPSGCGKTTLMRAVVGVQANVAGTVTVLGEPAGVASRRGSVGYMTQDPSVYNDLSIAENLTYFGRLLGTGAARIQQVLRSVRLENNVDDRVDQLSGGQRARVSLAIALLNDPALLVLDEPTVGLDPVLRQELWEEFSNLTAQGTAVVVSSHVMDEASRCDMLLLMRDGRILARGSPGELMSRTGTTTVEAAFLQLVVGDP